MVHCGGDARGEGWWRDICGMMMIPPQLETRALFPDRWVQKVSGSGWDEHDAI